MVILEAPFVSAYMQKTLSEQQIPVLRNEFAQNLEYADSFNFISEKEATELFRNNPEHRLYTNSENAIAWVNQNLDFTQLPRITAVFKNKFKFRELVADMYPAYFFKKIKLSEIDKQDIDELRFPLVLKPVVGFLSMGVYVIERKTEWEENVRKLKSELESHTKLFPDEVFNNSEFIAEAYISGTEYAFDAFFDARGRPVVTNIMKHLFAGPDDVSDRVYFTSREVIKEMLRPVNDFLKAIGKRLNLINYPVHVEIRQDAYGNIIPIEVNPLRFGGWCTIPDLSEYAFGINPYVCVTEGEVPDWNKILAERSSNLYAMILLNNSTGILNSEIKGFDYDKLLEHFENPLELRKNDYKKQPVFGFVYTETRPDNMQELLNILHSDLTEFLC